MSPFLPGARNKLLQTQAELPARDTGHNLFTAKFPLSAAACTFQLRMPLILGGTILVFGFGAANSLHAASANGMAPTPAVNPQSSPKIPHTSSAVTGTALKTSAAPKISAAAPGGNLQQSRPFDKHALNKAHKSSANNQTAAIPESTPLRQTPGEQPIPQARNNSPIHITRQQSESIDPLLRDAYLAYQNGKPDEAQQLYLAIFRKDAHNADVLLGLAAIALQREENLIAAQYYSRVLTLDPRNALANAGMSALNPDDDANESRLKILLREQGNSAALHFALGNLYAGQSRWGEAQQAYFNAYALESGNAGVAFNLAVSLDHLGQKNSAVRHYQNALRLDQSNSAGFDHAQILQRIRELIH